MVTPHEALATICQRQALVHLQEAYQTLLQKLNTHRGFRQDPHFLPACREAARQALASVKQRQSQVLHTLELRLARASRTKLACADPLNDLQTSLGELGLNVKAGLLERPASGAQLAHFYHYLHTHGGPLTRERLRQLTWVSNARMPLKCIVQGEVPLWVPRRLAREIPRSLSTWAKRWPRFFRGTWFRWRLFQGQGSALLQLQQGLGEMDLAEGICQTPLSLLRQLRGARERFLPLIEAEVQRLAPLGQGLNRWWHWQSRSVLRRWRYALCHYRAQWVRAQLTQLSVVIEKLQVLQALQALAWQDWGS